MTAHRLFRSTLAALALVVLSIGVPLVLAAWGRSPLDGDGSLLAQLGRLPTQTIGDQVVFGLLTVAAWVAWGLFVLSFVTELAAALGVAARWRVPIPGPIQMGAQQLVMSLLTGLTLIAPLSLKAGAVPALPSSAAAVAAPALPDAAPTAGQALEVQPLAPAAGVLTATSETSAPMLVASPVTERPGEARGEADISATRPIVVVSGGDTPWGLAERHLGHGVRWRDIWDLNQGVTQPDGRAWVEPDLVVVGWHLELPSDATNLPDETGQDPTGTGPAGTPEAPEEHQDSGSSSDDEPEPEPARADETDAPDTGAGEDDKTVPPPEETGTGDRGENRADLPAQESPRPQPDDTSNQGDTDDSDTPGIDIPVAGLAAATALATGLILALQRTRRRQATRSARRTRRPGDTRSRRTERALLHAGDVPLVRWAGQTLAQMAIRLDRSNLNGACPLALDLSEEHGIELLWDQPVPEAVDPWRAVAQGWSWHLPYDPDAPVPPDEYPCPIPALVTIGHRDGRQLMVDLEALGSLAITGDPTRVAEFGSCIGLELGANEDLADAYVSTVGFGLGADDHFRRLQHASHTEVWNRLRSTAAEVDTALSEAGLASSFEYRISEPESYLEADLVLATTSDTTGPVPAVPARRGVGAILLDPDHQTSTEAHIKISHDGTARLEPLGIEFHAAGLSAQAASDIMHLLDTEANPRPGDDLEALDAGADGGDAPADEDLPHLDLVDPPTHPNGNGANNGQDGPERPDEHEVVASETTATGIDTPDDAGLNDADLEALLAGRLFVQVLGKPAVPDRPNLRRQAVTLTVFLACQNKPVAAEAMRHAIWCGKSRPDKTVWNLVGETRTGLGTLDHGQPILARANKHQNELRLSDRVTTDVSILRQAHETAQYLPSGQAIQTLSQALDLVQGPPFSGPGYEWAHDEGQVMEAETLIIEAALHLVDLATDAGQHETASNAIAAGFRALPGNEHLVRARMRLEHDLGNNTGVHTAWEELQRFLAEIDADPSEATTTLYTQLTRSTRN